MNENIKRAEATTVQCKIKKIYRSQDVVPFFFYFEFRQQCDMVRM